MNNRINKTIDKYGMLQPGDKVLVAVSGGADSMLLLNHMISIKDKYGITIAVAHMEHGIRGQESLDDAGFVAGFCKEHNIEYHQLSIDAIREAKALKIGVEEYSRKRRYDFFESIPCDKIATAHNLSDNAETLLFRMARGTGLKGAGGIPAVRGKIIRPLIELSSAEIREYCNSNNIIYRTDSTNKCNNYTRNYIRNEILPKFKEINPGFETAFSCFMSDANDDIDFIEKCADEAYERSFCDNKLRKDILAKYDPAVSKRVVLKYFSNYNISLDRLHLNEIMKLTEKTGKIQICSNYFAASDKDYLRLAVFGTKINDCSFVSEILKISEFDSKGVDFYCDYDKIIGQVKIRRREAGDIISPANRGCSKSLKKLYNELKIPQEMRSSVGVMADEQGVIGVIGYCVDERVKVDRSTKKILSVKTSFGGLVNE